MKPSDASQWSDLLGPVLTPEVVMELLDITSTELDQRRSSGAVLGVRTDNPQWVYPLRQFRLRNSGGAETLPGLSEVLAALGEVDGLGAARWLGTSNRRLEGATPMAELATGGNLHKIIAAAQAQAGPGS